MYSKTKMHAGLMSNCDVCTPNRKKKRAKFKKERIGPDVISRVKKQMGEEIGEDILTSDQNFVILQKFGIVSAKIDRKISKPYWKGDRQWFQEANEWFRATKGLVPLIANKKPIRKNFNESRNKMPQQSRERSQPTSKYRSTFPSSRPSNSKQQEDSSSR